MKTLVIGANGQIGRIFCSKAHQAGLSIRAMVRKEEQASWFASQGIETVIGDLEGDFQGAMEDCQQVIFTAGSGGKTGPDKTLLVDLYGAIRSIDFAKAQNIQRFIMISAMRAMVPQHAPDFLRPYAAAKFAADHYLRTSGVPYLILLPGRLIDEPATHSIRTSQEGSSDITISRENVAECMVASLQHPKIVNQDVILLDGPDAINETFASLSS